MSQQPIRAAVPADTPRLVEVSRAAGGLFAEVGIVLPPDDPAETIREADHVLVAGEPPLGFAALVTVDGEAHLEELAVHPDHGRRGIGGRLVEAACDDARRRGNTAMTLTTFRHVPWNAPWYAARGWRELPPRCWGPELAERWRAEEAAGIAVAPRVAMRRDL